MTTPDRDIRIQAARAAQAELKRRDLAAEGRKWRNIARPNQLMPDGFDWQIWLVLAGRGWGKTRTAAEGVREVVEGGRAKRIALVGPTAADCRDVMVEGESGIMNLDWAEGMRPIYEPTKRRITWPNGVLATTYSADEPERLRGPQHDFAWCDEICAWWTPQDAWDMLMFGLRLGKHPQCIVSTTPKPLKIIRDIAKMSVTRVVRGSTFDNRANLAPTFFDKILSRYQGTRLGKQEIEAELLDDAPDALWQRKIIDETRIKDIANLPEMVRIVVSLDPAVTSNEESDSTGIAVCGLGKDGHGYVLADLSCRLSPEGWAAEAVNAFHRFKADGIVGEVNNGGELIETTLRAVDDTIPFRAVRASRGKVTRAEPVSALYEKKQVHHVGNLDALEDQMSQMTSVGYTGVGSPDRMDSVVWGLTELMLNKSAGSVMFFNEFQQKPRDEQAICHVVPPAQMAEWSYKWLSVAWGNQSTAHWYAEEPDRRVHVFDELCVEGVGAEEFGVRLARQSRNLFSSRMRHLTAHLPAEHFSREFGGKSVADMIANGINKEFGQSATFVWQFSKDETLMEREDRLDSFSRRRESVDDLCISLQHVSASTTDETTAGWEHLRGLLRWWGPESPGVNFDRDFAMTLLAADNGKERFEEYMRVVDGTKEREVLPKILFHENAKGVIASIGSMVRDDKNPELPKDGGSQVAKSLLVGVLAHRASQTREPAEAAVARKLNDYVRRNPTAEFQQLVMVEMKARSDHKAHEPKKVYRFPVKRRAS